MEYLNLKGKMMNWGPFEENESKWLIFSVGNPNEGHGPAIPRATDDFLAKKAAYDLEFHTGQRYVAHIPFTTDSVGVVAKDWSPAYIPWEDFFTKTIEYLKYHINLIKERNEDVSRVLLINGHGGNRQLFERKNQKAIQKELGVSTFLAVTALVDRKDAAPVLEEVKIVANKMIETKGNRFGCSTSEDLNDFYTKLLLSAGHASHVEHSLMAALGMCDMQKIEVMNKVLASDFDQAFKLWPPIGGLGGYLLAGGKYLEALKTIAPNEAALWNCFNGLKTLNQGKLIIAPELGELIFKISLEKKTALIKKYL